MGENGFGFNECKICVEYYDFENKAYRDMYIDLHEISSIDVWDGYSSDDGHTCVSFKDATQIYVSKDSYERILHLWLAI